MWNKNIKNKPKNMSGKNVLDGFFCILDIQKFSGEWAKWFQGTEENTVGEPGVLFSGSKRVLISHAGLCGATKQFDYI